jgi:hypothetical protein
MLPIEQLIIGVVIAILTAILLSWGLITVTVVRLPPLSFSERWEPVQQLLNAQALDRLAAYQRGRTPAWCVWKLVQAGVCIWNI